MKDLQPYENLPPNTLREKVIEILKESYAFNYLDENDFESRVSIVTNSADRNEILETIRDLPEIKQKGTTYVEKGYVLNRGKVKLASTVLSIMSGVERKGVWKPPRDLKVVAVMGGSELDFTQAEIPPGESKVGIFCLMGGVEITVPEGVNIDAQGFGFMGGFENGTHYNGDESAPTIIIRGVAIMGGIEINYKKGGTRHRHKHRDRDRDRD